MERCRKLLNELLYPGALVTLPGILISAALLSGYPVRPLSAACQFTSSRRHHVHCTVYWRVAESYAG